MELNSNSTNDPEEPPKPKPKTEQSGAGRGGKKKPTAVGTGGGGGGGKKKRKSGGGHEEMPKKRIHIDRALTAQELGYLLGVAPTDVFQYLFYELKIILPPQQKVEVDIAKKIAVAMGYLISETPIHDEPSDESAQCTIAKPINLYKLLQVDPAAESGLIRQAYRYLAEKYHPDNKVTGDEKTFLAITEAWKLLSDYARRAMYDESLNDEETS